MEGTDCQSICVTVPSTLKAVNFIGRNMKIIATPEYPLEAKQILGFLARISAHDYWDTMCRKLGKTNRRAAKNALCNECPDWDTGAYFGRLP